MPIIKKWGNYPQLGECVHVCECICAHTSVSVVVQAPACLYVLEKACVCARVYAGLCTSEHITTRLTVCVCVCMRGPCVCRCVYVCVCVHVLWTSSDHYGKCTLFIVACHDHYQQRAKMDRRKWKAGWRSNRGMFVLLDKSHSISSFVTNYSLSILIVLIHRYPITWTQMFTS